MAQLDPMYRSPRDHDIDANPNASRKRARLSPEKDHSPGSTTTNSDPVDPVVEFVSLDDEECKMVGSLGIASDTDEMIDPHSKSFDVLRHIIPMDQIRTVRQRIDNNYYIEPETIANLATWLHNHMAATADMDFDRLTRTYLQDEAFFSEFAALALGLISNNDWFHKDAKFNNQHMAAHIQMLILGLAIISARWLTILPLITKDRLARRDSGQAKAPAQHIAALHHVQVAELLYGGSAPCFRYITGHRWFDPRVFADARQQSLDSSAIFGLVAVFRDVAYSVQVVANGWHVLDAALQVISKALSGGAEAEVVIQTIDEAVLPLICEKHPRALPSLFHERTVIAGARLLQKSAELVDLLESARIYAHFVQSDEDALLPNVPGDSKVPDVLGRLCDSDTVLLAELMGVARKVQAYKKFALSGVMDVRSVGVSLMVKELDVWYQHWRNDAGARRHQVIVDYLARYLRVNDIPAYILSADSHASIVGHSANILIFLAGTTNYTDHETDLIWRACTTSVEADFAKAAFEMLHKVFGLLSRDQLFYLAQKFATAPIATLTAPGPAQLWEGIVKAMQRNSSPDEVVVFSRSMASLSYDLLQRLYAEDISPRSRPLHAVALHTLTTFRESSLRDRLPLFERCVRDIKDRALKATCAYTVLNAFGGDEARSEDVECISGMLTPLDITAEMEEYTGRQSGAAATAQDDCINGMPIRLELLLWLMVPAPDAPDVNINDRLFDLLVGGRAPTCDIRQTSWSMLSVAMGKRAYASAAQSLSKDFIERRVPTMPASFVTRSLIEVLVPPQDFLSDTDSVHDTLPRLLAHPPWKALVRFAVEASNNDMCVMATVAICHLLFARPRGCSDRVGVVEWQSEFVRDLAAQTLRDFANKASLAADEDVSRFCRTLALMVSVLDKSRGLHLVSSSNAVVQLPDETTSQQKTRPSLEADTASPGKAAPAADPTPRMTVAQAVIALTEDGAKGQCRTSDKRPKLNTDADMVVGDTGIEHVRANGLSSPEAAEETNGDRIAATFDAVEEELSRHYDHFESFLDGPPDAARLTHALLTRLQPSERLLCRIMSPTATAAEVFPAGHLWKCMVYSQAYKTSLLNQECVPRSYGIDFTSARMWAHTLKLYGDCIAEGLPHSEPERLYHLAGDFIAILQSLGSEHGIAKTRTELSNRSYVQIEQVSLPGAGPFVSAICGQIERALDMPTLASNGNSRDGRLRSALVARLYGVLIQLLTIDGDGWAAFKGLGSDHLECFFTKLLLDGDESLTAAIYSASADFCKQSGSSMDASRIFWDSLKAIIPMTLAHPFQAASSYQLALTALHTSRAIADDPQELHTTMRDLAELLHQYHHSESVTGVMEDTVIFGLLRLLEDIITMLKDSGSSLLENSLAVDLAQRLLFPRGESSQLPLLSDVSREAAYRVIALTANTSQTLADLAESAVSAMETLGCDHSLRFPGHNRWIRSITTVAAGLSNLGMTCYVNSLVQQLFANVALRRFVFDAAVLDPERQKFLTVVQYLFANMQDSLQPFIEPLALAQALEIQVENQEDVHGFYATFLSRLEDALPDQESRANLGRLLTGTFKTQVKGACGHVSTMTETFNDISITVKNKASLQEGLAEFVEGEPLAGSNKYRCMTCDADDGGRLVDAMKRTALATIPDSLTFCLKRFTFEAMMGAEGKVNDSFEFPPEIDMAVYKQEYLETKGASRSPPDIFNLVGVIVHQGSLQFGHYWSYVRQQGPDSGQNDPVWTVLEDDKVRTCPKGILDVQEQCFGGTACGNGVERADNAYVLFYQRRAGAGSEMQDQSSPKKVASGPGTSEYWRATPPDKIAEQIYQANLQRLRIGHLFSESFEEHVLWLLERLAEESGMYASAAPLVATYMLRVLLCHAPAYEKRLPGLLEGLVNSIEEQPCAWAEKLAQHLVMNHRNFARLWTHEDAVVREKLPALVIMCLSKLKRSGATSYGELVSVALDVHGFCSLSWLDENPTSWPAYLAFATGIARLGLEETVTILDSEDLLWALEVITFPWLTNTVAVRSTAMYEIRTSNKTALTAVFAFVDELFQQFVDHWTVPNKGALTHDIVNGRAVLTAREYYLLHMTSKVDNDTVWALGYSGMRSCVAIGGQSFPPAAIASTLIRSDREKEPRRTMIEVLLLSRIEHESNRLPPLLQMTLAYIECVGAESALVFDRMIANLPQWENYLDQGLRFLTTAYILRPSVVIEGIRDFTADHLVHKVYKVRKSTLDWLQRHAFAGSALDDECTASRMLMCRQLVTKTLPILEYAYKRNARKVMTRELSAALSMALNYLETVREEVTSSSLRQQSDCSDLLMDEVGEATGPIRDLRNAFEEMEDWESEASEEEHMPVANGFVRIMAADPEESDLDDDDDEEVVDDEDDDDISYGP